MKQVVEVECLTPRYRVASFESWGFGAEAMSPILDATSLLPTGIVFDMVVVMIVAR